MSARASALASPGQRGFGAYGLAYSGDERDTSTSSTRAVPAQSLHRTSAAPVKYQQVSVQRQHRTSTMLVQYQYSVKQQQHRTSAMLVRCQYSVKQVPV